jgi:hypothetical protein
MNRPSFFAGALRCLALLADAMRNRASDGENV